MATAESQSAFRAPEDPGAGRERRPLRIVFVLRDTSFLRFFMAPLEALVERGHAVQLLLEDRVPLDGVGGNASEVQWLERMVALPSFEYEVVDHFSRSRWTSGGYEVRRALNYVRTLAPEFDDKPVYRWRSERRSREAIRKLAAHPLMQRPRTRALLFRLLSVADRAVPRPPAPGRYLERTRPDVVAVCDYGIAGSLYSTYVEAARRHGIPVATCVASWDNLTSRQLLGAEPDALLVWNEQQREEAVEIHGVSPGTVVITGAQCFDHWFDWTPRPRREFCRRVGLDPERPFALWVGGALAPAELTEAQFVAEWLAALRASEDPGLRELGVLLRPHPKRFDEWQAEDLRRFDGIEMWPREASAFPTGPEERADFFDSIFHSVAVLGINTSAMIEAAIVGRPVLGIRPDVFRDSHEGSIHFAYIAEDEGGFVRAAGSIDEHLAQLRGALGPDTAALAERNRAFVARFVRPRGVDRRATDVFVEELERLPDAERTPWQDPWWIAPVRATMGVLVVLVQLVALGQRGRKSIVYRSGLVVDVAQRRLRRDRTSQTRPPDGR